MHTITLEGSAMKIGDKLIPFSEDEVCGDENDICTNRRIEMIKGFLNLGDYSTDPNRPTRILDIGGPNWVAQNLQRWLTERGYYFTVDNTLVCDFNVCVLAPSPQYDVVWCFEVLEHPMNPLLFLREAAGHLAPGGIFYLSTPLHNPFGFYFNTTFHFVEYLEKSIRVLFDESGLDIVDDSQFRAYPFVGGMIMGGGLFRTFLRVISQKTFLCRAVKR